MKQNKLSKGEVGEQLVSNFFDHNFSKIFSFSSPKTKNNAEVADVLIWSNRTVFLIEVKTRDSVKGTAPIESWCHSQIKKAHLQITKNISRIKYNEKIYVNNKYYHSELDCGGNCRVFGLIILVHEEICNIKPSEYLHDIYSKKEPIQVISWNDIQKMTEEIETVPDLIYYLQDRYDYLKLGDIPLDTELDVIGYYKSHENKFPKKEKNFLTCDYYSQYKTQMKSEIKKRNEHNKHALWIEQIESILKNQRKLMIGIPIGLLFAWELGALSLRERAYYGEAISNVQQWFLDGKNERYFSYQSQNTENWILFYFTQSEDESAIKKLKELTRLKMIREVEANSFKFGVYSLCFRVSSIYPYPLMEAIMGIIMGCDAIEGKYTKNDIDKAFKKFGKGKPKKIEEFPM
jgi:hypothetical protein